MCCTFGGEAGGDRTCHQARYVRVFKDPPPLHYLRVNTDTTLHLQNLHVLAVTPSLGETRPSYTELAHTPTDTGAPKPSAYGSVEETFNGLTIYPFKTVD